MKTTIEKTGLPKLRSGVMGSDEIRGNKIAAIKAGLSRNPNERDREAFNRLVYDENGRMVRLVGDLLDKLPDFFDDVVPKPYERLEEDQDDSTHIQAAVHDDRQDKSYAVVMIEHRP